MPAKSRKRQSTGQIIETVPNTTQKTFPGRRRSVKDRQPTWSAPSKYQQTITQMNPFHAIYHPDSDTENLEYDEVKDDLEEESYQASPVARKRRKISPEKPPIRRVSTRSSARKSEEVKACPPDEELQVKLPPTNATDRAQNPVKASMLMPPPQTPRSFRKREIPSSQSPVDSPLSTQSRRSVRDYSRSPLKERSTNVASPPPSSRRRGVRWATKLEVEDSIENEEEESQRSTKTTNSRLIHPIDLHDKVQIEELPSLARDGPVTRDSQVKEIPNSSQQQSPHSRNSHTRFNKTEIIDSDYEVDEDDDDEEDENDNEAVGNGILAFDSPKIPTRDGKVNEQLSTYDSQARPIFPTTTEECPSEARPVTLPTIPTSKRTAKPPNPSSHPSSTPRQRRDPKSSSSLHTDPPPSQPPQSDSQDPSAQLLNDLAHATQPGGLQTESQYEGGFASYHPGYNPANSIDHSPIPSSQPNETMSPLNEVSSPSSTQAPMTVPTQILPAPPSFLRPTPKKSGNAIPPSQATTTDLTQTQYSPPKASSSSLRFPSSPPPMPPPSSSPTIGRKALDPWKGFEWDGVRLTDSQLLPESLMDDGIELSNGGLEWEDEE